MEAEMMKGLTSTPLCIRQRKITGTASQTGKYYNAIETASNDVDRKRTFDFDETEDMFYLLRDVLTQHPEANAVSAGAILSTYQRTRVESVATRLGLIPLAYLWHYPFLPPPPDRDDSLTSLLDDMDSSGYDARIIKIASGGISEKLLFANVAEPGTRQRLISGLSRFCAGFGEEATLRGAVLGEGGEYETIALDGPSNLWKMRIELDSTKSCSAEGGTHYAVLERARVVAKERTSIPYVPMPACFDRRFDAIVEILNTRSDHAGDQKRPAEAAATSLSDSAQQKTNYSLETSCLATQVSNLVCVTEKTAATQLEAIVESLAKILNTHSSQPTMSVLNVVSVTLLLRSIDDFASVNQVYSKSIWPARLANPPARVTVAAPLPEGVLVSLSLMLDPSQDRDTSKGRKGLHVQSRSYWAPANIGPYSQAISVPTDRELSASAVSNGQVYVEIVHMAGQIPLQPASLSFLPESFSSQAVLALQHLWRVGQERGVDVWAPAGVAYLARKAFFLNSSKQDNRPMLHNVGEAATIWMQAHLVDEKGRARSLQNLGLNEDEQEEEEEVDIWDLQRNRGFASARSSVSIGQHLHVLPNYDIIEDFREADGRMLGQKTETQKYFIPTFIAAEVQELPRHASIEWWSTGISGLSSNNGNRRSKVRQLKQEGHQSWSIHGIVLEHHADNADTTSSNEAMSSRKFTFFLALLVTSEAAHDCDSVPLTIEKLEAILLSPMVPESELQSFRCELTSSHSFLNLSSVKGLGDRLDTMPLIKNSTKVPCFHVWASTGRDKIGDTSSSPTQTPTSPASNVCPEASIEYNNDFQEVAAAVILRIDAFSSQHGQIW
ncbi:hypothetical protein LTS08_006908 [Lithohypha guttulata]|nr:hypothetical protein LTS08_006908 [Lithohypha guttulata]